MAIFDLTKQQVVDILADFEEKLPNNGLSFFTPSANFNPRDTVSINVEAARMNQFLKMEGYSPLVCFEDLSGKGAASHVDVNDSHAEVYEITISNQAIQNNANALRVLAHEVCHKFLAIHDMHKGGILRNLNEAMTELCIIYMGFGLIVLNGYTEEVGYLNLEDFCHAFCVVYRSRGMGNKEIWNIVPEACKPWVKKILQEMTQLQEESMRELVINSQISDFNFRRRVRILQLLLDNMPEIKMKHNQQDGMFRNRQELLKDGLHPIQEMLLRETIAQNSLSDSRLDKCCDEMDRLIDFMCSTMKVDIEKVSEGVTKDITCPSCGFVSEKKRVYDCSVLQCKQCHHLFAWDGSPVQLPMSSKNENSEERPSFWRRLLHFGKKGI